jgi:hypothetical protein
MPRGFKPGGGLQVNGGGLGALRGVIATKAAFSRPLLDRRPVRWSASRRDLHKLGRLIGLRLAADRFSARATARGSALGDRRNLGGEVITALLDALAQREAHEGRDAQGLLDLVAEFLNRLADRHRFRLLMHIGLID